MPQWPAFNPKTLKRVEGILRSGKVNYWTGLEGRHFETAFSRYIGVENAVSVSSGTAALHLALEALGVGSGDEVICTPYSFRASAMAAVNAGATPVFADTGKEHLLTAATIAPKITPRTRAVVVVHLYGQVAEMGPILRLAHQHHFAVVEDCAQCLGGEYHGHLTGTLGDVGCFSFCQSKHITTGGEGGMVVTASSAIAERVRSLRDHGWRVGSNPKAYERVGYNFRLTEIQSVVGLGELERFERWNLPQRRKLAETLLAGLRSGPAARLVRRWPVDSEQRRASFWLVPVVLDARRLKCPVGEFIERVQREGGLVYKILWPLMTAPEAAPMAKSLMDNTIGFWVHPTYALSDIRRTLAAFNRAVEACGKLL